MPPFENEYSKQKVDFMQEQALLNKLKSIEENAVVLPLLTT